MSDRSQSWFTPQYNRRQFLKRMAASAAGISVLSACAAPAAPAPAAAPAQSGASSVERSPWVTGNIPQDASFPFSYTGWEGEEEMRKWLLHFDNFFKTNYPNVQVNGDWGVPWGEYWTKLPTQLAAGAPIDMCWMHDTRAKTFAANDWLLPLDDYLSAFQPPDWPTKFYPSQVEAFQFEGKQYGIPYDFAPGGLYINVDMFEEAGIDLPTEEWTFDQFLDAAKALTRDSDGDGNVDRWGCNLPTNWPAGIYWIVKSFGGDFWDAEITQSKFDDPATAQAFQYVADLMWEHQVMPSADVLGGLGMGAGLAFSSGLIGMHWSLNDEAFVFGETIADKFKWSVAPSPTGSAGRFQFVGGSAFSIPKTSTQPDLAYELIRYTLTNPDALKISGEMGSQFTGNMDFYEFGLPTEAMGVDRELFKQTFYELGRRDGIHPVYHPKYLEWETTIYATIFDRLWTGEERDAAAACAQAHEQTNALLSS